MSNVLVIGATSAIAEATARLFAVRGARLYLVGRRSAALEAIAADLRVRGSPLVGWEVLDLNDLPAHPAMLERAATAIGAPDVVLIAHGTLGDQAASERSVDLTVRELTTNGLSVAALLTLVATQMEARASGTIAVISSVAGERGRQSNYVYGSAKAMVTAFTSGLRQRLAKSGVAVITIKPGFVDTPMTAAIAKGGPLWAKADAVAAGILRAIDRGTPVVYLPWFWYLIMCVIRAIPERLFVRLKI
jgi:short-subunit dehydrogenase